MMEKMTAVGPIPNEGKGEHRDEGKSRRLTQLAQCVAYVPLRSLQQHS